MTPINKLVNGFLIILVFVFFYYCGKPIFLALATIDMTPENRDKFFEKLMYQNSL